MATFFDIKLGEPRFRRASSAFFFFFFLKKTPLVRRLDLQGLLPVQAAAVLPRITAEYPERCQSRRLLATFIYFFFFHNPEGDAAARQVPG